MWVNSQYKNVKMKTQRETWQTPSLSQFILKKKKAVQHARVWLNTLGHKLLFIVETVQLLQRRVAMLRWAWPACSVASSSSMDSPAENNYDQQQADVTNFCLLFQVLMTREEVGLAVSDCYLLTGRFMRADSPTVRLLMAAALFTPPVA